MKNADKILEQVILALRELDMKSVEIIWGGYDMPVVCRSQGNNDVHEILEALGRAPSRQETLEYHRPGFVEAHP